MGTYYLFGNCGHLDIDEANQYLTCGNLTAFLFDQSTGSYSFTTRRTMVASLAPSIWNPVVQVTGGVGMTGGIGIHVQ